MLRVLIIMQVSFNTYQHKAHRQSFKSNENAFFNKAGKVVNKTVTYMFRSDMEWNEFARLLDFKYKNANKINFNDEITSEDKLLKRIESILEKQGFNKKYNYAN